MTESFEKRQRERRKRQRREEKRERRVIRTEEKRRAKTNAVDEPTHAKNAEDQAGQAPR